MKHFYYIFLSVLVQVPIFSYSQNETAKWYFGQYAGLDFMSSPPGILTNGQQFSGECTATISDAAGNLLFYTDGTTVWNQQQAMMANGDTLFGDISSSNGAVIVKKPGSSSIYYLFYTSSASIMGGMYAEIDMTLAAGMGSVTAKNIQLFTPAREGVSAVRHCNGSDTWVVFQEYNTNVFKSFLVTASGVNTVAVSSAVGTSNIFPYGTLKLSPNGKKLAISQYMSGFELYDFDVQSGLVSNPQLLSGGTYTSAYGCEFSPDNTKLYGIGLFLGNPLVQWDLCAGSNSAIAASETTIAVLAGTDMWNNPMPSPGQLQLAKDGKMYISEIGRQKIAVINNPNNAGLACNLVDSAQSVAPMYCQMGLPNFISSFFDQSLPQPTPPPFTSTVSCNTLSCTAPVIPGQCSATTFSVKSIGWLFGEPSSGSANTSSLNSPVHIYGSSGTYTVKLIHYYACGSDTSTQLIIVGAASPQLSITGNTVICKGQSTTLTASGGLTYSWSTSSALASIVVSPTITTVYSVTGTHTLNACKGKQTVSVTVLPCTALEEAENGDPRCKVYPNPFNSDLFIECSYATHIVIYDARGNELESRTLPVGKTHFTCEKLSLGLYFIRLSSNHLQKMIRVVKTD
jgi:PKD repeat protein